MQDKRSALQRVYSKIVKTWVEQIQELEQQSGFRGGVDNIFGMECNLKIHFVFIGLQKAYNFMLLNRLWKVLTELCIDEIYVRTIRSYIIT